MNDGVFWILTGVCIIVALTAISYLPLRIAPDGAAATTRDILDLQNKIRQTVIQVAGGLGILFTVYIAIQTQRNANSDLSQRYDSENAELFMKAVEAKNPEALFVMNYIALRDSKHYRETVLKLLVSSIQTASRISCRGDAYKGDDFVPDPKVQVALSILAEREDRGPSEELNLEESCLVGIDLKPGTDSSRRVSGLSGTRMSGSKMLRIDFTNVDLIGTQLMGIEAGDWHNPGWTAEIGHSLADTPNGSLRRSFVAHFTGADLTKAVFTGAGLEGADFQQATLSGATFDGANLSRADFRNAKGLDASLLIKACVGRPDQPQNREIEQPHFSEPLNQQLKDLGGVPLCS
jgi:uncharacterized protein YjbI with pentapeptide repeats